MTMRSLGITCIIPNMEGMAQGVERGRRRDWAGRPGWAESGGGWVGMECGCRVYSRPANGV